MAQILKGTAVAEAITQDLLKRSERLKELHCEPTLAIVRMGHREDDESYRRGIMKRCEKAGIAVREYSISEDDPRNSLMNIIRLVNADPDIHGCLVFRPLPDKSLDDLAALLLNPAKDVDSMTMESKVLVYSGKGQGFYPCTAQAVIEICRFYGIELSGKAVTVLGRSEVIGKPVSLMLQKGNATVTMCHSKTKDLKSVCLGADIIVSSMGRARIVKSDWVADGAVLIDVGINFDENGKMCGDFDPEGAEDRDITYTPVPGGVGSVTSTVLAMHVIEAAEKDRS